MKSLLVALASLITTFALWAVQPETKFDLQPGDHICIIGNTLAERMQHYGWLETYVHSRYPKHNLVFRNLGFAGDELTTRLRSANFGTPHEWLTKCKADVIFAFFGYNESFAGEAGLEKFKNDLDQFIKHTLHQKYNGKSPPRLVLFSPLAQEDLKSAHLPSGQENNDRLQSYTQAIRETAKRNNALFVDLFSPSQTLYRQTEKPLTINGIHLSEYGDNVVANAIEKSLFDSKQQRESEYVEKLRAAVNDKNFYWFERYRTTDGYSIFGGRADLKFVEGQTNRDVAQREMEILDLMTANRDKRVWGVAQGEDPQVDDSNLPPFVPVKTNKPGKGPNGEHLFLSGEEAIKHMTVAKGFKVNLFASEEMFPELAKPVQMSFDPQGRLWVAIWPSYPHWKPTEEMNDKLLILEDTKGVGKADKCRIFADKLTNPTGFELCNGGAIVAQAPNVVFLKDTKGDGKAHQRDIILSGIDSADTHHTANSFTFDPGGALYWQEGTFHRTQVETPYTAPVRCADAGVYRYEPRTQKFETYISFGFANPHGHAFDHWGQDIVIDGTGSNPYHAALFSGRVDFPNKHSRPPQVYQQWTRPCPGIEVISSRHFPEEMQGNLLVANVIGYQGILNYKIRDKGASFEGIEAERILSSDDPNFRPSDLKIGPDGAIYFLDWHNPIIGHMQHNLRDPSRDRKHGRIYRITYEGRPLLEPIKIAGQPVDKLLDLLKKPEDRVHYRTRIELGARPSNEVISALKAWLDRLDKNNPQYEHHVLEALWLHQSHDVVNVDLLQRVLASPDFHARAAATRVLCYWRDRVPEPLALLRKLGADPHPRVRLEAVRAASFLNDPEAVEIPLIAQAQGTDEFIDFTSRETMKALEPYWKTAQAAGKQIKMTTEAGKRFLIKNTSSTQLLKMERTEAVCEELLIRAGIQDEYRQDALRNLARIKSQSQLHVLMKIIHQLDESNEVYEPSLFFDLARLISGRPASELVEVRSDLEKLALDSRQEIVCQMGFVALLLIDQDPEKVVQLTTAKSKTGSAKAQRRATDYVLALSMVPDMNLRVKAYPRLEESFGWLVLHAQQPPRGRFVRIELPGKQRTLTLAEVEVFSAGTSIATKGKASQSATAHGGVASRAIDGNKSGTHADGGQTHTPEDGSNPWWEVDLGGPYSIDEITIYNRTDGNFYHRLNGFTVKVLDEDREVIWQRTNQPAPANKVTFAVKSDENIDRLRQALVVAMSSVRGKETQTFQTFSQYLAWNGQQQLMISGLLRIPRAHWPKDQAEPLFKWVFEYIKSIPTKQRTEPIAMDALEFADALTTFLPTAQAKAYRKQLSDLGVRVLRIGTLLERMSYDKDVLVVQAGKPVEFLFENHDMMPHNLVIAQPGAMEEIGLAAEASATSPDAAARQFVPKSDKILLASRLLQPREMQKLSFTAPSHSGVYPIVCTYPGHWLRMNAALYVVADLDDYLAGSEVYLAAHPLAIKDALLKDRRPRTEWKMEDLQGLVGEMKSGRSHANGKAMFKIANCVACHKLDGIGNEFAPDLAKLDPKWTPTDILKNILEPSFQINEKFQTWIFVTISGKSITGIILDESADAYKVIENPLLKAEPITLKKSDVEEKQKSSVSTMPKGLLDTISREEILDLIAYLAARGDTKSEWFQKDLHGH